MTSPSDNVYGRMNQLTTLENIAKLCMETLACDVAVRYKIEDGQGVFSFCFYWNMGTKHGMYTWQRVFTDLELMNMIAPVDSILDLVIQSAKVVYEKKKADLTYVNGDSRYEE